MNRRQISKVSSQFRVARHPSDMRYSGPRTRSEKTRRQTNKRRHRAKQLAFADQKNRNEKTRIVAQLPPTTFRVSGDVIAKLFMARLKMLHKDVSEPMFSADSLSAPNPVSCTGQLTVQSWDWRRQHHGPFLHFQLHCSGCQQPVDFYPVLPLQDASGPSAPERSLVDMRHQLQVRQVVAMLFSGVSYEARRLMHVTEGDNEWISHAQSCRIMGQLAKPIEGLVRRKLDEQWQALQAAGTELIIAVDGAWSQRRNASNHMLTILNGTTHQVLDYQLASKSWPGGSADEEGNYTGSSRYMESWCLLQLLDGKWSAERKNMVKVVVADRDAGTAQIVARHLPDARTFNDPGHIAKNIAKSVERMVMATGRSHLRGSLPARMKRWYMTIVKKTAAEFPELDQEALRIRAFISRWQHTVFHYCGLCRRGCPCQQLEGIDDSAEEEEDQEQEQEQEEEAKRTRHDLPKGGPDMWEGVPNAHLPPATEPPRPGRHNINVTVPKQRKVVKKLARLVEDVSERASALCHPYHTCGLEGFNAFRTLFTPKDRPYRPGAWRTRCAVAVLAKLVTAPRAAQLVLQELGVSESAIDLGEIARLEQQARQTRRHKRTPEAHKKKATARRKQRAVRQRDAEQTNREMQRNQSNDHPHTLGYAGFSLFGGRRRGRPRRQANTSRQTARDGTQQQRPKKRRRCGKCHEEGHNARTCLQSGRDGVSNPP